MANDDEPVKPLRRNPAIAGTYLSADGRFRVEPELMCSSRPGCFHREWAVVDVATGRRLGLFEKLSHAREDISIGMFDGSDK